MSKSDRSDKREAGCVEYEKLKETTSLKFRLKRPQRTHNKRNGAANATNATSDWESPGAQHWSSCEGHITSHAIHRGIYI